MTVVEFFDRESIENIVSMLLCSPVKVIFVGHNAKKMYKAKEIYRKLADQRNILVEIEIRGTNRNNLAGIVETLTEIVEKNEMCTFDLSGGEDLFLVAAGIVYDKYPDKVQLHRFNMRGGKLSDCDMDGNLITQKSCFLKADEFIEATGGRIIYNDEKRGATSKWVFDEELSRDIEALWNICKKDTSLWNTQVGLISAIDKNLPKESPMLFGANELKMKRLVEQKQIKGTLNRRFLEALEDKRLISDLVLGEKITFRFKNQTIKNCLTKSGLILELFVTLKAKECKDEEGNLVYNEVLTGVVIDWDGKLKIGEPDVWNEIDVLLIRGLTPVFISCKNGDFHTEELYKLAIVSERFGGKNAKKVIIATDLENMGNKGQYIRLRAAEMGIKIIDNLEEMSEEKLNSTLLSFYK